jgi:hypothetical protein
LVTMAAKTVMTLKMMLRIQRNRLMSRTSIVQMLAMLALRRRWGRVAGDLLDRVDSVVREAAGAVALDVVRGLVLVLLRAAVISRRMVVWQRPRLCAAFCYVGECGESSLSLLR